MNYFDWRDRLSRTRAMPMDVCGGLLARAGDVNGWLAGGEAGKTSPRARGRCQRMSRPPRAQPRTIDFHTCLWQYPAMNDFDWRGRVILSKLREGCTMAEAAMAAGITRQGIYWRCGMVPGFTAAVTAARETGREERTFRLWLRHPFRGLRPPTGRGHGGNPRFSYGRR